MSMDKLQVTRMKIFVKVKKVMEKEKASSPCFLLFAYHLKKSGSEVVTQHYF